MTICGISVVAPDRAVCWADSALLGRGEVSKLAVNVLAGIVATGAGHGGLLSEADQAVHHAVSLEDVLQRLSGRMRRPSITACRSAYGVAGFDSGLGRMVAYVLRSPFFRPEPTTLFTHPAIEAPRPESALAAVDIALAQLVALREEMPGVSGGVLSVAELTPGGVFARVLFDLDAQEFIDGPRNRSKGDAISVPDQVASEA
ncbi:MAG: hypothetical protein JO212_09505 [Acetobacteraceae bacterium]|nr:hypothetical protein [Acetobacteraceae bacterium]